MNEPQIEFVLPSPFFAIPLLVVFIVLPAWLIWIVFKHTNLSQLRRVLLVPVCLVTPFLVSLLWPLLIKFSGLVKFTGPGNFQPSYSWYAVELFGDWSEYVWATLTTCGVVILWRVLAARKRA